MTAPSAQSTPTFAEKLGRSPAFIGATVGGALAVLLGVLFAIDVRPSMQHFISLYIVTPTGVGVVFGAIIGWAFGVVRRRDAGLFPTIVAWMLLGAVVAVFTPATLGMLYGWSIGIGTSGFPLRGTGASVTPFGIKALGNASQHVTLFVAFLGLPIAAVGAVIGAIIAAVRWARRPVQTQMPENEPDQKDYA